MKKLDIYIIRQFLSTLSMTLMGFVSVILVVDLIENLDRFIDNSIPAGITFTYYIRLTRSTKHLSQTTLRKTLH